MKSIITLIFLFIIYPRTFLTQNFNWQTIYQTYQNYREPNINEKRILHSDLIKSIQKLKVEEIFRVELAGKSLEGRDIYHIILGKGKTNVLLWSQMHGDEPTATMALLDIFNFFNSDDNHNNLRANILEQLSLHFIPMLNPDGAEEFKRRNSLYIDLNRDALRVESPESKILKVVRDSIKADFGFNLHDQNSNYSAGNSFRSATISFLAPAYNFEKEINEVRANTMKVISDIYGVLNTFIPGHIAKYKDDFEPRAFGDNFIKWGTSSVLIESGGWKNDDEKQFIRKLNFIAILAGLSSIATKSYENADIEIYNNLPYNDNLLFDLLLKNLSFRFHDKKYKIDIGINRELHFTKDQIQSYSIGKIEDWGDLSVFYGYDEYNLDGYEIKKSKIFELKDVNDINELDLQKLLKNGYGFVRIDSSAYQREYSSIPFNLILGNTNIDLDPKYEGNATFTIWNNGKLKYNVINGYIYNTESDIARENKGTIIK